MLPMMLETTQAATAHEVEQEGESRVEATDDVEFHELVEDDPRRPTDIVDPGSEIAHQTHDGTLLLLG